MTDHAARASACIAYHMAHHCTVDNVTSTYCPRCIVEAAITQALRDAERAGLRRAAEVAETMFRGEGNETSYTFHALQAAGETLAAQLRALADESAISREGDEVVE